MPDNKQGSPFGGPCSIVFQVELKEKISYIVYLVPQWIDIPNYKS